MNGRRAKKLRRIVEQATVGHPWRAYVDKTGKLVVYKDIGHYVGHKLILSPSCGRAIYQKAKKL